MYNADRYQEPKETIYPRVSVLTFPWGYCALSSQGLHTPDLLQETRVGAGGVSSFQDQSPPPPTPCNWGQGCLDLGGPFPTPRVPS